MNAYANASITIDCTSLLKYVNQETTLSSHPSPIFFLPGISVYKEIKNFDEDPISYEEEIDLQASYQDYWQADIGHFHRILREKL